MMEVITKAKEENFGLTERELKVLEMIVAARSNKEIAMSLYLSRHTVKLEVSNLLRKMGVSDRIQAAVKALKSNIVQ